MKKSLLILLCLIVSFSTFAEINLKANSKIENILVVGDSHTAGPFGSELHKKLSKKYLNVSTLGHASSAAYHWINEKDYKLSGGVFNKMQFKGKSYFNPNPTHWKVKVSVPKFDNIIENMAYHDSWKLAADDKLIPDLVVIALGANDSKTIMNTDGSMRPNGYQSRLNAIKEMISLTKRMGAECIWVGPPNGIKKTEAGQKTLYKFVREAIGDECKLFDSNKYKCTGCDGVHFSCSSQRPKAVAWAKEVSIFIQSNY